jgi:SAM-dependent methyltransferase
MKIIKGLSALLSLPAGYRIFQRMVGGESSRKIYLTEYARPAVGDKILDIGCGPADILNHLPKVNYTGLDISPEYICAAKKRFGSKGRFFATMLVWLRLRMNKGLLTWFWAWE